MSLMDRIWKGLMYIICIQQVGVDTIRWLSVLQYFLIPFIENRPDLFSHTSCIFSSLKQCLRLKENSTCGKCWPDSKFHNYKHEIPSKSDPSLLVCPHLSMSAGMFSFTLRANCRKLFFLKSFLLVFLLGDISALHSHHLHPGVPAEYLCSFPALCPSTLTITSRLCPLPSCLYPQPSPQWRRGYLSFLCTQDVNWEFKQKSVSLTSGQYPCHHAAPQQSEG